MDQVENRCFNARAEEWGARVPRTPQEDFVKAVYASVDETIASELERLHSEEGTIPACRLGCCHCCRYLILTNVAEVHTLAQYVKRELSPEEIRNLQMRTRRWHEWDDSLRGRNPSVDMDGQTDLTPYDPCCPLLVNGACRAYGVRPVACRIHFVRSSPSACHAASDPGSTEAPPPAIGSLLHASTPFRKTLRDHIEESGLDYSRSMTLLPHGLAIEMGWDFALSLDGSARGTGKKSPS